VEREAEEEVRLADAARERDARQVAQAGQRGCDVAEGEVDDAERECVAEHVRRDARGQGGRDAGRGVPPRSGRVAAIRGDDRPRLEREGDRGVPLAEDGDLVRLLREPRGLLPVLRDQLVEGAVEERGA
jgi:hypothetical protein